MVCSLLTAADVEAATGAKPEAEPHPAQLAPPGSREPMQMCTWVLRPLKGQVVVSAAHAKFGSHPRRPSKDQVRSGPTYR